MTHYFLLLLPSSASHEVFVMKLINACVVLFTCLSLQGCAIVAVADVVASTVIYTGKTVVNVIDAVTPDIVNKKKKEKKD
jgi:hypothetical protein